MGNFQFNFFKIIPLCLLVVTFGCHDESDVKTFTGRVTYFDTDESVAGLEVKMQFLKFVTGDHISEVSTEIVAEFNSITDANGNYAFTINPSNINKGASFFSISVASNKLIELTNKNNYRNCETWNSGHFLISDLNRINSYDFIVDSVAFLRIEFDKVDHSSDGLVEYGTCNVIYSATNEFPDVTDILAIPTGYYDTTKVQIFYCIATSQKPNPSFIDSDFIIVHVGDTTTVRFEY